MRSVFFILVLVFTDVLSVIASSKIAFAQDTATSTDLKHESVQLARLGPERRFGRLPAGVLYTRTGESPKTVVLFVHPESDSRNDWRAAELAKKGFGTFGLATRYVKEDHHNILEEVMLDLAEAIRFLKEERGFTHVILHGHSGGGGTVSFYQNQAQTEPPNRVSHTPAGDPPNLNQYDLPPADGLILSSAHLGRGYAVARKLDPSVVDEDDPLSVDPSLDLFDPANGYRIPPEASMHSEEFMERFRSAQHARMQRLMAKAFAMVEEKRMYQRLLEAPDFENRSAQEQLNIQRGAVMQRYMTIYRNFANPFYVDPTIDPNDRALGAGGAPISGSRPDLYNYYAHFHPRNTTPEAFLSGNSLASNVFTPDLLPQVTVPLLVTIGSADPSARMSESRTHYEVAGGEDKEFIVIEGADHSYNPAGPKAGARNQREQLIEALAGWLSERFPH